MGYHAYCDSHFLKIRFPYHTAVYWLEMSRKKKMPIFKINEDEHVIKSVETNVNTEYPPDSKMWEMLNQETCKVTFQRLYREEGVRE